MNGGHHLILGKIKDFISGRIIEDTHDERYRQEIARLLVEEKGFSKNSIEKDRELRIDVEKNAAILKVDYLVSATGKTGMLLKYGPGSITTRHQPALALSRMIEPYQIPVVVVTNGKDADILDGGTGKLIAQGLNAIFSKKELTEYIKKTGMPDISPSKKEMATRIVYAFEINGRCPCDDAICVIGEPQDE